MLGLCDVTEIRLRCPPCFSPHLNVCNGARMLHCEQEVKGLFTVVVELCKLRAQFASFF